MHVAEYIFDFIIQVLPGYVEAGMVQRTPKYYRHSPKSLMETWVGQIAWPDRLIGTRTRQTNPPWTNLKLLSWPFDGLYEYFSFVDFNRYAAIVNGLSALIKLKVRSS